ncbi:hypothetical protein CPT_Muenster_106 [Klebsiella phage Muenster]|nr:hypothetical protein CPT_Muenster_106 [Klebsiella phage Muenster]
MKSIYTESIKLINDIDDFFKFVNSNSYYALHNLNILIFDHPGSVISAFEPKNFYQICLIRDNVQESIFKVSLNTRYEYWNESRMFYFDASRNNFSICEKTKIQNTVDILEYDNNIEELAFQYSTEVRLEFVPVCVLASYLKKNHDPKYPLFKLILNDVDFLLKRFKEIEDYDW